MAIKEIEIKRVMFQLMDESVAAVTVNFDGGGDSGDIYDMEFWMDESYGEPHDSEFFGLLEDIAYDLIADMVNDYGGDWYNGDGGYGNLQINVDEQTVSGDYNQRTVDEYCWSDHSI